MECCRDGCPSGRFSHLYRGTSPLKIDLVVVVNILNKYCNHCSATYASTINVFIALDLRDNVSFIIVISCSKSRKPCQISS
jgi:hypothetical protein